VLVKAAHDMLARYPTSLWQDKKTVTDAAEANPIPTGPGTGGHDQGDREGEAAGDGADDWAAERGGEGGGEVEGDGAGDRVGAGDGAVHKTGGADSGRAWQM